VNCPLPLAVIPVTGALTVNVWLVPLPLKVPVAEPLTPATVAVIVTLEAFPAAVTNPLLLTVAQELELCQVADLVSSLFPPSNVAVAYSCCVPPCVVIVNVLLPVPLIPVVTVTSFGWLTKNPRQLDPTTIRTKAASAAVATSLFRQLGRSLDIRKHLYANILRDTCPEAAPKF
jgi:hypothetical protein